MYPYDDDEHRNSADAAGALGRLVQDPLYWRERDPQFLSHVERSFQDVFGKDDLAQDATGRTMSPEVRSAELPTFRPSVLPGEVELGGGVGERQPNRWRDVYTVQKGLANTGHYALDLAKERSGGYSPALRGAIENFQREHREEIDGLLLPSGPTIRRLRERIANATPGMATARFEDPSRHRLSGLDALSSHDSDRSADVSGVTKVQAEGNPPGVSPGDPAPTTLASSEPLPTETLPKDPADWGNRAVIVRLKDGTNIILRNPTPPEKRIRHKSDFEMLGGTAAHAMPENVARARYRSIMPMTEAEAAEARENAKIGRFRSGYDSHLMEMPLLPAGDRIPIQIRYYLADGTIEDHSAFSKNHGYLYGYGREKIVISARDAARMGMQDWMTVKPPEIQDLPNPFASGPGAPDSSPRYPGMPRRKAPAGPTVVFLLDLIDGLLRQGREHHRIERDYLAPRGAEPTWR